MEKIVCPICGSSDVREIAPMRFVCNVDHAEFSVQSDEQLLQEALTELDSLVGLENVKEKIKNWVKGKQIEKERIKAGLHVGGSCKNLIFVGNPGTGKTKVGQIIGKIGKALGLLSKGHLVEVAPRDLIAGYVGQTGAKTREVCEQALGGVLFIDEAYSLGREGCIRFAQEAILALLMQMADHRDDLIVIAAGYASEMPKFLSINPGLFAYFKTWIDFPDYDGTEMMKIFQSICQKYDYVMESETKQYLQKVFDDMYAHRDKTFANGRTVRTLFEKTKEACSERLQEEKAKGKQITREYRMTLKKSDILIAEKEMKKS